MDTFKKLKLKNYFFHLISGTLMILLALGILQAIVLEMIKEYDVSSRVAYICGIAACGAIVFYGIYEIRQAFCYESRVMKGLEPEERERFMEELTNDVRFAIPGLVVMTTNYLLVPTGRNFKVSVLQKEVIIACFQPDIHREKTATLVELIIYDRDFRDIRVMIRGKESAIQAAKFFDELCRSMPWIFHEDYDGFLAQSRKSGYRRKLIGQMEDAKMRYETGYNSESEAEEELQAMSEDVKERLDHGSLLKRFLSRKSK